jgi:hypothetical protein
MLYVVAISKLYKKTQTLVNNAFCFIQADCHSCLFKFSVLCVGAVDLSYTPLLRTEISPIEVYMKDQQPLFHPKINHHREGG